MKKVIFIWEPNDLQVFNSIHDAEISLEPIDVKAGIYTAYDSEGYILSLSVHTKIKPYFWGLFKTSIEYVVIQSPELKVNQRKKLKEILIKFLKVMCVSDSWLVSATYEDLVQKVIDING